MTTQSTACEPTTVLAGDIYCLDRECDHEHSAEAATDDSGLSYCEGVREEIVCGTHSSFVANEDGFEELVDRAPWPCPTP